MTQYMDDPLHLYSYNIPPTNTLHKISANNDSKTTSFQGSLWAAQVGPPHMPSGAIPHHRVSAQPRFPQTFSPKTLSNKNPPNIELGHVVSSKNWPCGT